MHVMEFPRTVILGENILNKISDIISYHGLKNPLILSGDTTYKIAGKKIAKQLNCRSYIVEKTNLAEVKKIEKFMLNKNIDCAVGVGGGRITDAAKLSSALTNIHWISVPTSPSNDSMSSNSIAFLLSREVEESFKDRPKVHPPIAIFADMNIIEKAPKRMLAAGCGDLISNYTAVKDWKLANELKGEYFSDYASSLSLMSATLLMENVKIFSEDISESYRIVVKGLSSSGVAMSIAGSSRPASGSEHMFSHALDLLGSNALHGEQSGIGTIMMMHLHRDNWEKVRETLKFVSAPTNSEEIGIDEETIVKALTIAHKIRERYTILGTKGLTTKAARDLAKKTKVIS